MNQTTSKPLIRERWESPCGRVVLLRGDAFKITPTLEADALISDPPYGIAFQLGSARTKVFGVFDNKYHVPQKIRGDNKPFNPVPFMHPKRPTALFGANFFNAQIPKGQWFCWDKTGGGRGSKAHFCDAEFAWLSFRTPRNIVHHLWKGMCREKIDEDVCSVQRRQHVSQKPIRVMMHLIREAKLTPASMVLDPFMGSGSTGIAALKLGHRFTGIEIDAKHFKTAKKRFEAFLATLPPSDS